MKIYIGIFFFLLGASVCAQTHLSPPDGGLGVPGRIPGSFAIEWEAVAGAIAYEYVLTDNENCFVGCAGDTRQGRVTQTQVFEFDLREGAFYYWITRVFFDDGTSTGWSQISAFQAVSLENSGFIRFVNPVHELLILQVDWQAGFDVQQINARLIDQQGRDLLSSQALWPAIRPRNGFERFSRYELPLTGIRPGVYFVFLSLQKIEGEELQFKKIIIK